MKLTHDIADTELILLEEAQLLRLHQTMCVWIGRLACCFSGVTSPTSLLLFRLQGREGLLEKWTHHLRENARERQA